MKLAPVRRRRGRVQEKIDARFGAMHYRDREAARTLSKLRRVVPVMGSISAAMRRLGTSVEAATTAALRLGAVLSVVHQIEDPYARLAVLPGTIGPITVTGTLLGEPSGIPRPEVG